MAMSCHRCKYSSGSFKVLPNGTKINSLLYADDLNILLRSMNAKNQSKENKDNTIKNAQEFQLTSNST